jgi:hypothetical protein
MARVLAFIPDLLFGSNVVGALRASGDEPVLVGDRTALHKALVAETDGEVEALIVDLTFDVEERIETVRLAQIEAARGPRQARVPALAFYSHVEADVRDRALAAGFDLVVPRSRMAREGPALLRRLLEGREAAASGPS